MSASISLHHLSYATPDGQPLFNDLELSFGTGRTGLIGRNGTGKSTLLRLIVGTLQPSAGSILRAGTLGSLDQAVQIDPAATVAHQLGVGAALARLDRLDAGAGTATDMAEADWTLPSRIAAALNDVQLPALDPHRLLTTLSGGQRTRLALAKLILAQPDIILLDEPTNNLDAEGRAAIGALLRRWQGAAIVVSHDRALLRTMDAIVELTTLGATLYGGNWDVYSARKAAELAAAEHGLATAERKIGEIDRKIQAQAERKSRKDAAGARKGARGD
ncbi:MAG TPA: ATP-binding cassette domain-containing protein, partial [Devosia sp.]|nr:ATP-binding cassette domain-containing protein [Devosia sp.]